MTRVDYRYNPYMQSIYNKSVNKSRLISLEKNICTPEKIKTEIVNSWFLASLFIYNTRILHSNGYDPLVKALVHHRVNFPFPAYKNIHKRWGYLKNPKINLDTIRNIDEWENKIDNIIDREISNMRYEPPNMRHYLLENHYLLCDKIVEKIIHEIWLPEVLSRFQRIYKKWYYQPNCIGARVAKERFLQKIDS